MFMVSFLLLSFMSVKAGSASNFRNVKSKYFSEPQQSQLIGNLQQLSEKEETETENDVDLEMCSFNLPFHFTLGIDLQPSIFFTSETVSDQCVQKPAYLLNSVFRI